MQPDAKQKKDVYYFRELVFKTGLTQGQIAKRIGVTERTLRNHYRFGPPYLVQFAVECILYDPDKY